MAIGSGTRPAGGKEPGTRAGGRAGRKPAMGLMVASVGRHLAGEEEASCCDADKDGLIDGIS
uniref:Uncharacterized protein n=1 Tax=Leersia perrieri TaxID=77586 RepID=A0A0D9XF44_9ORYZ